MPRIHIDLTTSIRWRRPPVGIVRVEREFAKYCLAHEPDTVFCEVDPAGIYRALTRTHVREVLDDAWCGGGETARAEAATPLAAPAPVRGRVQRGFDWLAAWGPKVVPAAAYPLLRDLGRVLVDHHAAWARNRDRLRARKMNAPTPSEPATPDAAAAITPRPDDLFFSVGLQWHHGAIHAYHLKKASGVRVVEFCHDTIPLDHPEHAGSSKQPFADYFTCLAHTADLIATNSDSSRHDLTAFYDRIGVLRVPRLHTVHLASPKVQAAVVLAPLAEGDRAIIERLARVGRYVLYVSTFEVRKNHRLLLTLWKELFRERGEACPVLVLVGMFGWGVNDLWDEMRASEVWAADKIVLLQHVSDALLAQLYRDCTFTVFPSLYEGWGLAASESLAYGKLAIVSNAPALAEATQGLCPAIHPLDYPAWRAAVTHYLDDAGARSAAEARIRSGYRPRDWDAFSRELLAAARETA